MSDNCVGCSCRSPAVNGSGTLVLFATRVEHTVGGLLSLASRYEATARVLAPGLLAVESEQVEAIITAACGELTSVEADEVHCLVLAGSDVSSVTIVSQAMTAPSLAEAAARVENADLTALFEDERQCFYSVFQKIVSLTDSRVIGHEALLRAETPDGDLVMPDVLFPAAEAAGWTHLLDRVGRTTALRDAGPWIGDELLFINFVPTSIYRPEVCLRTTEAAAARAGVQLNQLVFEVTEGHKIEEVDHLERVFDYYRSQQCKVALDDLGSGYSSLNLLVRLQPDVVKLDKEIVQALPGPTSTAVVSAIVEMVHSYGGLVLAECIETEEQAASASELHVDLAQGWLFGRPERPVVVEPANAVVDPLTSIPVRPYLPDPAVAVTSGPGQPDARDVAASDTGRTPTHRMVERSTVRSS